MIAAAAMCCHNNTRVRQHRHLMGLTPRQDHYNRLMMLAYNDALMSDGIRGVDRYLIESVMYYTMHSTAKTGLTVETNATLSAGDIYTKICKEVGQGRFIVLETLLNLIDQFNTAGYFQEDHYKIIRKALGLISVVLFIKKDVEKKMAYDFIDFWQHVVPPAFYRFHPHYDKDGNIIGGESALVDYLPEVLDYCKHDILAQPLDREEQIKNDYIVPDINFAKLLGTLAPKCAKLPPIMPRVMRELGAPADVDAKT